MNACTLLAPELGRFLDAAHRQPEGDRWFVWPGRARWQGLSARHFDQRLFQLCLGRPFSEPVPTAAVLAANAGLNVQPNQYWLALAPGQFSAEMTRLMANGFSPAGVGQAILDEPSLSQPLRDALAEQGLQLRGCAHGQLLASGDVVAQVESCTPLQALIGRNALTALPKNRDNAGVRWYALFNEIQMILHDALAGPGERNDLPCNGLWPHGVGRLPDTGRSLPPFDAIACNDPVVGAIAGQLSGLPVEAAREGQHLGPGRWLVVLEASENRDGGAYWRSLCLDWLQPLLRRGFRVRILAERHGGWRLSGRWWPWQRARLLNSWPGPEKPYAHR